LLFAKKVFVCAKQDFSLNLHSLQGAKISVELLTFSFSIANLPITVPDYFYFQAFHMALFVRISISNYNDLKIHVGDCSFIKLPLIQSIEIMSFQSGLINFII